MRFPDWPMRLLFTDPYSGHEIVLLGGKSDPFFGFSYDPRSISPPSPWSSSCPHCVGGRNRDLSIHLKREIRIVASMEIREDQEFVLEFSVPTNGVSSPARLTRRKDGSQEIVITGPGSRTSTVTMDVDKNVTRSGDEKLVKQVRRPQILGRCVRMLFSAHKIDVPTVLRMLTPFVTEQQRVGYKVMPLWSPCRKIDWCGVVARLMAGTL